MKDRPSANPPMPPGRPRGRQTEARRNDRVVLDAARMVFAVHGPDAPVSSVAAAAGVGMGTLYRRYPSKVRLLQFLCQASMEQQIEAAEAALSDEGEGLAGFIRSCVSFRAGAFAPLAGTIGVTSEMVATAQHAHWLLEALVDRAHQSGGLRLDAGSVDIHQLIELFSRRPADDDGSERLLAIALDGLRWGPVPLPGCPPPWPTYARRWGAGD